MEASTSREYDSKDLAYSSIFDILKEHHDLAYSIIDQALKYDENKVPLDALQSYREGLVALGEALSLDIDEIRDAENRNKAKDMIEKMKKSRQEILERMQYLDLVVSPYASLPPDYEAIMTGEKGGNQRGPDGSTSGGNGKVGDKVLPSAQLLLDIPDGVQLFFIDDRNNVTSPSEPSNLKIFKIDDKANKVAHDVESVDENADVTNHVVPPAVLHVGSWIYPLFPGQSPVLRDLIGAYMFPDLTDPSGKSYVGVILSSRISREEREEFEDLLQQLALFKSMDPSEYLSQTAHPGFPPTSTSDQHRPQGNLADLVVPKDDPLSFEPTHEIHEMQKNVRPQRPAQGPTVDRLNQMGDRVVQGAPARPGQPPDQDLGERLVQNIIYGTDWIAKNVQYLSDKAEEYIREGSKRIQDRIDPSSEPAEINPIFRTGAYVARRTSNWALRVTQYSVTKFGAMTVKLAKFLAPYVRKSTVLIPQSLLPREKADHAMNQMLGVAEQSIIGISTVFLSLEMAGTALANSLANETVHVVQYKYGHRAGDVTQDALMTATNLAKAGYNLNSFGPKAIMLNTARKSGVAFVEGMTGSDLVKERQEKERAIREHFEQKRIERDRRSAEWRSGNGQHLTKSG